MDRKWVENPIPFYIMEEPGNTTVLKIQRQIERNIELIKPNESIVTSHQYFRSPKSIRMK